MIMLTNIMKTYDMSLMTIKHIRAKVNPHFGTYAVGGDIVPWMSDLEKKCHL